MMNERAHLASLEYWRRPAKRVAQRFYVAFCLLMSSIQDRMLGLKGRDSFNMNWSATCSYYSLVHGGRLICFLALGDFPSSHSQLRSLIGRTQRPSRHRRANDDGYPFDWLRGFTRIAVGGQPRGPVALQHSTLVEPRQMIVQYLEETRVQDASRRLQEFANILGAAGPLRNDSNYEALLIAHEYHHLTMSTAFDQLAEHMATAAGGRILHPWPEQRLDARICAGGSG